MRLRTKNQLASGGTVRGVLNFILEASEACSGKEIQYQLLLLLFVLFFRYSWSTSSALQDPLLAIALQTVRKKLVSPSNQNLINTKNMHGHCRSTLNSIFISQQRDVIKPIVMTFFNLFINFMR